MFNKKIKIMAILIVLTATVPLIYKEYINRQIVSQIKGLSNKGFMIINKDNSSSYLTTSQKYTIVISDPQKIHKKFFSKILPISQSKLVERILNTLNGAQFSIELNILNFPVNHENAINIYFTKLPAKLAIKSKDNLFLKELSLFLTNKGIGEHINLNAIGKISSIALQNLDKKFENRNKFAKLEIEKYKAIIKKADIQRNSYELELKGKLFEFAAGDGKKREFKMSADNLDCNIDRQDLYDYTSVCKLGNLSLQTKKYIRSYLEIDNIFLKTVSKLNKNSIFYKYNYKAKEIHYKKLSFYANTDIKIDNFTYKGTLEGISKDVVKEFSKIKYIKQNYLKQKKLKILLNEIIKNGFIYKIDELSASLVNIDVNHKNTSLGKVSISLQAELAKNNFTVQHENPLLLLKYLSLNCTLKLTEKSYNGFLSSIKNKKKQAVNKFAKHKKGYVIFDIEYKNGILTINDQKVS